MATLFEIFSRATRDLRPCHYHAVVSTLCSLWWLCLGIMRCGGNSDDPPLRGTMNIATPPPSPTHHSTMYPFSASLLCAGHLHQQWPRVIRGLNHHLCCTALGYNTDFQTSRTADEANISCV